MTAPSSVYFYSHCWVNPKTGNLGTVWDYLKHDGLERPELFKILTERAGKDRTGKKIIYMNDYTGKRALNCPKKMIGAENPISGLHEPDSDRPGFGYGDIKGTEDAILTIRDMEAGTLKVMVYPGKKESAFILFQNWSNGGVSESIPNNKVKLDTLSVMNQ